VQAYSAEENHGAITADFFVSEFAPKLLLDSLLIAKPLFL
jgi:hypothetical protein